MSASSPSVQRRSAPVQQPPLPRLGRYEALAELACGGTGTVYLARLQGVGGFERLFAVKTLHKQFARKPEVVELLLKEARITAQIQHPNVVDTVELGATDGGEHFLVMAYVEGVSLDDLLEHPTLDAIGRVRVGVSILLGAMSGLEAAHRAKDPTTGEPLGIVHRDISPGNILIGMDGIGRVADFGIASACSYGSDSQPQILRGTPRYMAPEQTTGGPVDQRADVFALGAVLWEVITGEPLFDSRVSVEHILHEVLTATIPPPSERNSRISAELDAVCLRALARDVDERFQTVAELRDALVRAAETGGMIAPPGELVDELQRLFGERVERRRELVRRAVGRKSGTRLRAISDTQIGLSPLRDAAVDSVARATPPRSSVTSTQIGIRPLRAVLDIEPPPSLDALLRDEEDEAPAQDAGYHVPRHHWRRWALLVVALGACALGWVVLRAAPAPAPAAASAPAATVVEPPRRSASVELAVAPEPDAPVALPPPAAAKPARVWKPQPARPRRAPATDNAAAPTVEADPQALLLELNPYLLDR